MKDLIDVIKYPFLTERSKDLENLNKYVFIVDPRATKTKIKQAIEKVYNVKVKDVHTINVKPKPKRMRFRMGHTPRRKKAIITLKQGFRIEFK